MKFRHALGVVCAVLAGCGDNGVSIVGNDAMIDRTLADTADVAPDAAPSVDTPMAVDAAPDVAPDVSMDALVDVVGDTPADAPDVAGRCRDDTDCGSNEFGLRVCDTVSGTCVACSAANRGSCRAGEYCSEANRCQVGCAVDMDCASDGGMFRCDVARHVCVGCVRDEQCPAGQLCGSGGTCTPGCRPTT